MNKRNRHAVLTKIRFIVEDHKLELAEVCELLELDVDTLLELIPNRFVEYSDNFGLYEEEEGNDE